MTSARSRRSTAETSGHRRVLFALFPGCEIMDVAGPMQAFAEATAFGVEYDLGFIAVTDTVRSSQGLSFTGLVRPGAARPGDRIIVPGYPLDAVRPPDDLIRWLRDAVANGAEANAVCTGAFVLGEAGLLDGRRCTTHWRRADELQRRFPRAHVVGDMLFVRDGEIVTSAGIAAGIDMALALLEQDAGPVVASHVAREMVVYMRRDATHDQRSVYLDYQTHLNPGIHRVQQHLINNPGTRAPLEELARIAGMSERHFSRVFRKATGITVHKFRAELRLERARNLLRNPDYTVERVAAECGYADGRQLRRLWRRRYQTSPRSSAGDPSLPSHA